MLKRFWMSIMIFSVCVGSFAGTPADDFQASKRFTQRFRSSSLDAMKQFHPEAHFKDYTKTPDEQRYYQDSTTEKVDLTPAALEALKQDTGGRTVYENAGKAPPVVINQTSEAAQEARRIEANSATATADVFCSDGSCVTTTPTQNTNAGQSLSALTSVHDAGRQFSVTQASLFGGHAQSCNIHGINVMDCCSDKGWGQDIKVANCQEEDRALGRAKQSFLVHYVGKYCAKRWPWPINGCEKWKHTYCVFDTKMARIIQEGRLTQVSKNAMGTAEHPKCDGLSVVEFQQLNMSRIDFVSPVYPYVNGRPTPEAGIAGDINLSTPNANTTTDTIAQHMRAQVGA